MAIVGPPVVPDTGHVKGTGVAIPKRSLSKSDPQGATSASNPPRPPAAAHILPLGSPLLEVSSS